MQRTLRKGCELEWSDVAERGDRSVATVSRFFNDPERVSQKTRKRIHE
ncbi:LacI family DNA-binding transcriptional regulator [Mesobaculum littorinae]|uniref:LacI family DNA-binding transcriptional regulator n=1 Tax=Mesobaculum littorinae TaxID=2486419 RepID=A0A438AET5_9RHOB|nr:LacI family DNA-binding transcriptional regulator [Mesobaculum littorinae]RVV97213.1 LacI family DNA-binding transcriptional regulator [Mesobaculum littorinae]